MGDYVVIISHDYGDMTGYLLDGTIDYKEGLRRRSSRRYLGALGVNRELREKYLGKPQAKRILSRYQLFEDLLKTLRDRYCEVLEGEPCNFFVIKPPGKYSQSSDPLTKGAKISHRTDANYLQMVAVMKRDRCNADICLSKLLERAGVIESEEGDFLDFTSYREACREFLVSVVEPYVSPNKVSMELMIRNGFDIISAF